VPAELRNVVAIAAGDYHSLALLADGSVKAWGQYRRGDGFVAAVALAGLANVVAIAAGADHDLAIVGDGAPDAQTTIEDVRWTAELLSLSLNTQCGRVYRLLRASTLSDKVWVPFPLVPGTGYRLSLTDEAPGGSEGFYRVQRW